MADEKVLMFLAKTIVSYLHKLMEKEKFQALTVEEIFKTWYSSLNTGLPINMQGEDPMDLFAALDNER